jgi:hypothetical protein
MKRIFLDVINGILYITCGAFILVLLAVGFGLVVDVLKAVLK